MLTRRLIPCLDVRAGRVVKGVRFQGLRDVGDPAELAAAYEAQGADELVLLDVAATREDRGTQVQVIRAVRARLGIPLTVGGGVRTAADAAALLEAGADKVSINSAAVARPDLVDEIATRFGRQCCVVAIDAARIPAAAHIPAAPDAPAAPPRWQVLVRAGTEAAHPDAVAWAREAVARGAGELLLTSWDRDGTGAGYDLDLLRAACGAAPVPVIASGGASSAEHLAAGLRAGAQAVLAATIFHDRHTTVQALKQILIEKGLPVRP